MVHDSSLLTEVLVVRIVAASILLVGVIGAIHSGLFWRLVVWLWRTLRSFLTECWQRNAKEDSHDEIGALVKERMQRRILDQFRMICQGACLVGSAEMATFVVDPSEFVLSTSILSLAECAVWTTVLACPSAITAKTMDCFHAAYVTFATLYFTPWILNPQQMLGALILYDLLVVGLLFARMRIHFAVPLNAVYVASTCCAIARNKPVVQSHTRLLILIQLSIAFVVPVAVYFMQVLTESGIREGLEGGAAKEMLSTLSALLGACYDVVVEASSEGVITSPAHTLGGFLLRTVSPNLQGTRLSDLLTSEEDKEALRSKLDVSAPSSADKAEAIRVKMVDADSSLLEVELFTFPFRHPSGDTRHMIGIRESPDGQGGRPRAPPDEAAGEEPDARSDDGRSDGGRSSLSGRSGHSQSSSFHTSAATLIADITGDGIPVVTHSSGFAAKIGRVKPGTSLLKLMPAHMEECFAYLEQAGINGSDVLPSIRVTLQMPQGPVKATVGVLLGAAQSDEGKHVELLFSQIKKSSKGERKREMKHLGTPSLRASL